MNREQVRPAVNGYVVLLLGLGFAALSVASFVHGARSGSVPFFWWSLAPVLPALFCLTGLFIVNPNEARVLILFGRYVGTVKENGFCWANPFYTKKRVSLRARNLNGEKIKVNDKAGNPIQIAAVVVWQVEDTYR